MKAKVVAYPVSAILRGKKQIMDDPRIIELIGVPLAGENVFTAAEILQQLLPGSLDVSVIVESIECLSGQEITMHLLNTIVWRFLGNITKLKKGTPVKPWSRQDVDEWVPLHIVDVHRRYSRRKEEMAVCHCLALAGTSCAMVLEKTWSKRFAAVLARRFGFSPPWKDRPFRDCSELFNLRFSGLVEAARSKTYPDFEQVKVTPQELTWNRELLLARTRTKQPCPYGYGPTRPCYMCFRGQDDCDRATHSHTFVKKYCRDCDEEQWFDPALSYCQVCINCYHKSLKEAST